MKLSKIILICAGLVMSGSLIAQEFETPVKARVHNPYVGYEFSYIGLSNPSVGYRYQVNSYLMDVNIGYKYVIGVPVQVENSWNDVKTKDIHYGKVGLNFYKVFRKSEKSFVYAGVGADFVWKEDKLKAFYPLSHYIVHPSVSFGKAFVIDGNKKIFFEMTYAPYAFESHEYRLINTKFRVGVGF